MKRLILISSYLIIICATLVSCSGIRLLPVGEKLYTGADNKIESGEKIKAKEKKVMKKTASNAVRPKPNSSFLGMRPKMWRYLKAGSSPETKINKWMQKTGEAPVYFSSVKPNATSDIIDAKLYNIGVFNSYTEFEIIEKQHTAHVVYKSHVHKAFTISKLTYSLPQGNFYYWVDQAKEKTLINPGDDYNLNNLKNERVRIDAVLKDNGYFFFDPDYLLFKADTSTDERAVTLNLTLKDSVPEFALKIYRINNVFIDQNYSLTIADSIKDTFHYQNIVFFGNESDMLIKPNVISMSVLLRKDEVYSRKNHNITLNRLMSMGNFKFARVTFTESDTSSAGFLDVTILLTPIPKHALSTEIVIVTKSNNYTGPRMNLSYQNRNTFRGAELLKVNLSGSYEAQFSKNPIKFYSYTINPQIELYLPRLIVPFKIKAAGMYIPKTRFSLSYNFLKRSNYFDMNTFQFIYGYKWRADILKEHELNPINISYNSLTNKSEEYIALLASDPLLKRSYEEQFIAGGNYSFAYNEQVLQLKKVQTFLYFTAETAGNAFSLANTIFGNKISSDNPSKVAGAIYSQFARVSADSRLYYNFKDKSKLAMRVFAGAAKPYGNSLVLPYTKQFFSGGPNSIRAFHINSVGPGTFLQESDNTWFLQLGGDVKLELNAEYRFDIFRFLKGAVFTDAGNVWLLKSNPGNAENPFSFSRFPKEIAVGAGFGLRIDVSFFILRFDFAMPLRKPWLDENQRWVINQIEFGSSAWRKENLILNVAIGYPF